MRFVILSFLYRYRYLGDGDTDRREILHNGTYRSRTQSHLLRAAPLYIGIPKFCAMAYIDPGQSSPPFGVVPQGIPKIQNFGPLENDYLENDKSQRYMSIRA